jgi:ankyrin repeat protein
LEVIQEVLDAGADINTVSSGPGNYGKTPIFYAITRGRDDVVVFLLALRARVRIVNNKGQSPITLGAMHLAVQALAAMRRA